MVQIIIIVYRYLFFRIFLSFLSSLSLTHTDKMEENNRESNKEKERKVKNISPFWTRKGVSYLCWIPGTLFCEYKCKKCLFRMFVYTIFSLVSLITFHPGQWSSMKLVMWHHCKIFKMHESLCLVSQILCTLLVMVLNAVKFISIELIIYTQCYAIISISFLVYKLLTYHGPFKWLFKELK